MITVQEANQFIKDNLGDFGIENIALNQGMGRVLREDVVADRDFPPYDRVTMDGIAIRFQDFENGVKEYPIKGGNHERLFDLHVVFAFREGKRLGSLDHSFVL